MINGVAVFSRNLAAGLKKRGHEVLVLAPSLNGDFGLEEDAEFGFLVARLSSIKMPLYPDQINKVPEAKEFLGIKLPNVLYKNGLNVSFNPYSEIKKVLDEFQPDIIHDQTPGPVALAVFRYAKRYDIPLVSTDHAYPDNLTQQIKLPELAKKPIDKLMNRYFMSFLKHSEYATMPTEQAVADLIPKNRRHFRTPVEALSNGIDFSRFGSGKADAEIYQRYGIPKDKPIILYVGRVDPEKSLEVLMRAFFKVVKKVPDVELVVVGDGTARPKLEEMAEDKSLRERSHFLGRIVGDDLPKIYGVGTVFCITSTTETQSIVVMEAMASGLPVVAVRAGAIPELVRDDKNGYLCKAGASREVANRLSEILLDKAKCKRMAKASLELIKKHDINHTLTRIEEIYNQVLAARRG